MPLPPYYLNLIKEHPPLEWEDCKQLLITYEAIRDKILAHPHPLNKLSLTKQERIGLAAKEKVILHNIGLIAQQANKYKIPDRYLEDIFQAGAIGLSKATDKFKTDQPYRFSTFAVWQIKQEIFAAFLTNTKIIPVPATPSEELREIYKVQEEIMSKKGSCTLEDICKHLTSYGFIKSDEIKTRVYRLLSYGQEPTSLTKFSQGYNSHVFSSKRFSINDNDSIIDYIERLSFLKPPHKQVLYYLYGFETGNMLNYIQVAEELNITAKDVERLEQEALDLMMSPLLRKLQLNHGS